MKDNKEIFIGLIVIACIFGLVFTSGSIIESVRNNTLALIHRAFPEKSTPESIKLDYAQRPIRILLVPGHDNDYSGAQFGGVTESKMNLETAEYLYDFLKYNPRFVTIVSRDFNTGNYSKTFSDFFEKREDDIREYMTDSKIKMDRFIELGLVEGKQTNNHNFAIDTVRKRLYGINMWANENNIDLVLHIHYNDYVGRSFSKRGEHTGYSIYIPEIQMPNSRVSKVLAESISTELDTFLSRSTLPLERDGIIETQELIAIGPNATRDGASVLIEYGYIYEPQLHKLDTSRLFFQEVAYKTYRGIASHFDINIADIFPETILLPYQFTKEINKGDRSGDVMRLQSALYNENVYPPKGMGISDCPISGFYGDCTVRAVTDFQEKYRDEILSQFNFEMGTGIVGPKTIQKINSLLLE